MATWDDYKRDASIAEVKTGLRRCVIVNAEETVTGPMSKVPGTPMIVVTVRPSGSKANVKTYIVKNERFNKNMTNFFDAFPAIGDGNFKMLEWIGAEGAADFGTDKKGYLEVKWFVSPKQAEKLPPFEGEKPEKQEVTVLGEEVDEDFPF